ncbi:tyrosinase family protein [Flavobacterium sp. 3HN19-14]|uniref:tyrosinase family protein n=1 Tax=Flavobacterium sp. 3HN19-14 TaxID=3448133 RepID=UPI003EDFB2A5
MTFTRKNAWNLGGTFKNPDLYWYAKAVAEMQSRDLDDLNSWWFFAAVHGTDWPNDIPPQPTVPKTPMPPQSVIDQYWAQCQHGTWFFPPWHRGYLYAFENVLRDIIISLGGPMIGLCRIGIISVPAMNTRFRLHLLHQNSKEARIL